ncbi:hypothetical protein B9Q33_14990 [Enterobacter kobei]|nr:hypothetical protein B9Q33_14990 [Enterobacter kobei]PJD52186.1 hypothetical protein B9Q23_09110 [Enterobacter kobei]PJD57969.1 hypothetical protein B9Q27_04715 [Enterobacter kobei]
MLTHQAQLVFNEWVFHFHNLHSLSPLRWHPQKNRGIIPLFSDCAIPILLDICQSKTKKPEARLRLGCGVLPGGANAYPAYKSRRPGKCSATGQL